jgi:hypothetical protein
MTKNISLDTINQLQSYQASENSSGSGFVNQGYEALNKKASINQIQPEKKTFFQGISDLPKALNISLEDNTLLATTQYAQEEGFKHFIPQAIDPNFDPFEAIPKDKLAYADNYKYANTHEEVTRISDRIDRELLNKEILNNQFGTGTQLVSSLISGFSDPVNFIPVGGQAFKAFKLGRIAEGAAKTAAAGLVSATAAEGILQVTQETRTAQESAANIAASTVFAGILGAAAFKFSKEHFDTTAEKVSHEINTNKSDLEIDPVTQEVKSVGSRQVRPYEDLYNKYLEENLPTGKQPITLDQFQNNMESLTSGIGGSAKIIASSLSKINPLLRTFNSQSIEAKNLLQDLATHNMLVGKNEAGIASQQSVETAVKQWRAGLGESVPSNVNEFKNFKQRVSKEGSQTPIKTIADWNIEVSKAMRRGDKSDIPEIAKAAKEWRSKVFDPAKNGAIETGLLPVDVKPETAVSYLSRLWNRKAVIAKEPELKAIISKKLRESELPKIEKIHNEELSKLANKVAELEKKGGSKALDSAKEKFIIAKNEFDKIYEPEGSNPAREKYLKALKEAKTPEEKVIAQQNLANYPSSKEAYINEITDNILSNLKGESRFGATSNYDFKITKRGPLKERTLSFIRDEEVEQFLENDIVRIADRYTRIMGTDIELSRKFEGDVNLEQRLAKVSEEYKKLSELAKTEEQRVKIQKEKQRVLGDLEALRDIMRGIYGQPDNPDNLIVRGGRIARQLNYTSKLGGVVLSSLNDTVNAVGVHGMARFTKGLGHVITNMKGVKLNIKEAKRAGNILESVLHSRMATMAELTDPLNTGHSVFERFAGNVAALATKLNGIALWNDVMKGFSSVLTQQRLIQESRKLAKGNITKKNRTYLAFLGIDEDNVGQIINQLETHGTKERNLHVANTDKWTDSDAVRLFRNALNQDVDRTIVTKTAGDVPLFMNTELGKAIGQFKSFAFASTQQVLIQRLQQADAAALNGFISAVSLGMLSYYVKSIVAGREPSQDPKKWIVEGIDKSGVLGIMMEINGISEKMTRGKVGINSLIGGEVMSRYASRNIVDTLAGPTAGQLKDLSSITSAIASGDIKESDVKAFRRMLPYQNIFYLQSLFDGLEKETAEAINAK